MALPRLRLAIICPIHVEPKHLKLSNTIFIVCTQDRQEGASENNAFEIGTDFLSKKVSGAERTAPAAGYAVLSQLYLCSYHLSSQI